MSSSPAESRLKRALDLVLAIPALILLSPAMLAIAIGIRATMGRPVLFWQIRPGYKGRSFAIVKFRTMREPERPDGTLVPLNERVTRLGSLLRRTSLDELPELWNVAKGEMSIVGPRPLLLEYLPRYSPEQARRHDARPGITGLAQVKGRHLVGWDDRFALDVWYVDHWSLRLDLKIIGATIGQLAGGQAVPDSTTENFWFTGTATRSGDSERTEAAE